MRKLICGTLAVLIWGKKFKEGLQYIPTFEWNGDAWIPGKDEDWGGGIGLPQKRKK